MDYELSFEATEDLEKIWHYTYKKWSAEQANYYYDLLMDEIEYLSQNPKSGKDFHNIINGYYRSKVKSHFIFYRVNFQEQKIEIIRILHQEMDVESRLND